VLPAWRPYLLMTCSTGELLMMWWLLWEVRRLWVAERAERLKEN